MPIKVQNPKTGEVFDIDVDESMQTDLGGGITPEIETKNMAKAKGYKVLTSIVNPKTGESHDIDENELSAAVQKGYVIPEVAEAKKPIPNPVSPTEAAGYGFAKFATMGAAPAVGGAVEAIKGGEYEKGRQAYEQRQEQAWQEQPTSYGLGGAAGVLPGIAAKGITTAGQVALGAAAPVIEQATKPITRESARETAQEAVMGGLMGGILGRGAEMQPQVAQKAGEIAERRAVKAIGADISKPQRRIERTPGGAQAFGRALLDTGIVTGGKTVPEMKGKAGEIAEQSGQVVGNIMRNFDKKIGVPSVGTDGLMIKLRDELSKLENLPSGQKNPSTTALVNRIRSQWFNEMEDLAKNAQTLSLEDVWTVRKDLDKIAYTESGIDKAIHKELQRFRNVMENELQKSARNAGIPEQALADYNKNKRLYQVSKEAEITALEKQMRMDKNRMFSLSDYLSGGFAGSAGSAIAGGPGGVLAATLGAIGNKIARERGPQVAAATLDKLSGIMKSDPALFQKIVSQFVKTGTIQDLGE